VAKSNCAKLIDILTQQDIVIIATLCKVYESEELSKTVIRIFNSEGQALRLLIQLIYRELKSSKHNDGQTLFRNDTMGTKTTRNYFKMIASSYMKKILEPLANELIANPKGYEIDLKKLGPNTTENLEENQRRLEDMAQKYLTRIVDSVNEIPLNMRRFFHMLRQLVKQCFPESELTSIGGFFFLRFLCPAIVSPEAFGVVDEINDPECRRALTLVAKVLQNLANDVQHFKEDFMEPLNGFLTRNSSRMTSFYEEISTVPESGPDDARRPKFTEEDRYKSLSLIVGQLSKHLKPIEDLIDSDPRLKDAESIEQNRNYWTQLKQILIQKPKS